MGTMLRATRLEIPAVFLKAFVDEPRIVVDPAPGLWPVDPGILLRGDLLKKLAVDQEFKDNFEILIVPK